MSYNSSMETAATPSSDSKPLAKRDAAGRLLPGSVINPTGRTGRNVLRDMREAFAKSSSPEEAADIGRQVYGLATQGANESIRLAAMKLYIESFGLQPPQEIEISQQVLLDIQSQGAMIE